MARRLLILFLMMGSCFQLVNPYITKDYYQSILLVMEVESEHETKNKDKKSNSDLYINSDFANKDQTELQKTTFFNLKLSFHSIDLENITPPPELS